MGDAAVLHHGNSKEVDRVLNDYMNPEPLDPGACTRGLYLRGVE